MANAYNIDDLRTQARRRLPRALFEFIDRGAEDDIATRDNRAALQRFKLAPRFLNDVRSADTATRLLGRDQPTPLVIAPTGMLGLVHRDGEIAAARAAGARGIGFCLSTASISSVEAIAAGAANTDLWFQLYPFGEIRSTLALVDRAKNAGFRVLVVTIDGAAGANREYNAHNHFTVPMRITPKAMAGVMRRPGWALRVLLPLLHDREARVFANYPPEHRIDIFGHHRGDCAPQPRSLPFVSQDLIARLRDHWTGPLLVKGLLTADDARSAASLGAAGVIVSNHGGRVLDASVASIDALADIVAAVGDRLEVLFDSGIRRGTDIAKALALGARGVLVGRAPVWGTAANGAAGAAQSIDLLTAELRRTMIQLGCATISDIGAHCLKRGG